MLRSPSQKTKATGALFKKQGQAFGAGFYLFLSILLFMSSSIETESLNKLRRSVGDIISPVIETVGAPIIWANDGIYWFNNVVWVFGLNQDLREENEILKEWKQTAQVLALENKRLKELLGSGDFMVPTLATARVIGYTGGPYVRSVLINKGLADGIEDGRPVVDENGIVGRVLLIGQHSARVLLINDLNSRVPVRIQRTNQNAMVVGLNDDLMSLMFYPVEADIKVGDRLLTSGNGRAYPPDIVVGTVSSIAENGSILVSPAATLDSLDFVRILDFDASLLEPEQNKMHDETHVNPTSNKEGQ